MTAATMSEAEISLCRSGRLNLAFFFRAVLPTGTIRMYAGVGDYPVPADGVETEDSTYLCVGGIGPGLADIDLSMNGQAQGLVLELPADAEVLRTYMLERNTIIGAPAAFGWGILDERYRPAGPIRWTLRGQLFHPRARRRRTGETTWERVFSATLIAGSYTRRRGIQAYATSAEQRRLYPDDAFFDLIRVYSRDRTRNWPS